MAPIPKSKLANRKKKPTKPPAAGPSPTSSRKRPADSQTQASGGERRASKRADGAASDQQSSEPDTELVFEDPYGDDYENEQLCDDSDTTGNTITDKHDDCPDTQQGQNGQGTSSSSDQKRLIYQPGKYQMADGEQLVCDESAYDIFYRCNVEWPALSFDYVCTASDGSYSNMNSSTLQAYPLSISLVFGTQANVAAGSGGGNSNGNSSSSNKLVFARMSNLHRNPRRNKIFGKGNQINASDKPMTDAADSDDESDDESDDDSEDDSDSDEDDTDGKDPTTLAGLDVNGILQSVSVKADSVINRVRAMPQHSHVIAYWTEKGRVHLLDGKPALDSLYMDSSRGNRMRTPNSIPPSSIRPFHSVRMHATEGYALDWSRVTPGRLLSGSVDGAIYLSEQTGNASGSGWTTCPDRFRIPNANNPAASVEDIQWSPNERDVFASCHATPHPAIRIWDVRQYRKPAISMPACHGTSDVNVIAWNRLESHLLASGGDDGIIKVWDLRALAASNNSSNNNNNAGAAAAAAEFALHQKAITAVQWHHTDPSMLCASSEDGTVSVWDLAVERDPEEEIRDGVVVDGAQDLPPQLLFIHMGQTDVKDVQWHPACPSLIVSTAQDGFNVFQPSNIALPATTPSTT